MQLGKPLSTKDYFSQKNSQPTYYMKKPVLMEIGSSKNTRPSNDENSRGPISADPNSFNQGIHTTGSRSPENPSSPRDQFHDSQVHVNSNFIEKNVLIKPANFSKAKSTQRV